MLLSSPKPSPSLPILCSYNFESRGGNVRVASIGKEENEDEQGNSDSGHNANSDNGRSDHDDSVSAFSTMTFSPTHCCPNKHYLLLQVDHSDPPEPDTGPTYSNPLLVVLESEHHLSFHALKGAYSVGTIRFQGQIQGFQIQVLLDSGSSDNFLQPRIAQCLKLTIHEAPQFQVLVGNGSTLTASGLIQDLPVTIQGHTKSTFWALSITFYLNNKFITLRGNQVTEPGQSQFHHIRRLQNTHSIDLSYTLQFHSIAQSSSTTSLNNLLVDLATLLHNYWIVFDEPTRLLPPRDQYHSIPLIDGSNPVKVKPYHYPHNQKAKIEKMVSEMLKQDIIQSNTSPFSSSILFGSAYFSKLDWCYGYHQILVHPEDRHKTAFRTHQELYEWLVMPFRLTNSPALVQILMNSIFCDQLRKTDASCSGIGVVLSQARHPIAYFSKKLCPRMQKQSAYVRELYAITEALAKLRHYLIGNKFVIKTDQRSLKSLTDRGGNRPEQQHWLHKFLGYDFTIEYKPGVDNIAADSLSRSFCLVLSMQTPQLISMIYTTMNNDHSLAKIQNQCLLRTNSTPHYQRSYIYLSVLTAFVQTRGTTLAMSTAYHPQTDGQSEAVNKCLELYLCCFTSESPRQWSNLLSWAEFWYNIFKVVYGRNPPTLIRYEVHNVDLPLLQQMLTKRDDTITTLKSNMAHTQQIMKTFADTKRRFLDFQFGPFPVIEQIGQVAYMLMLPLTARIHPVFHISALKLCKGDHSTQLMPLALTTTEQGPIMLPLSIIDHRAVIQNGQPVCQVQVQWEGVSPTETTWENWYEFHTNYPNLEDKVLVNEGSNVMIKDNIWSWQQMNAEGKGQKEGNQGHVVNDSCIMKRMKGKRERIPNRKYSSSVQIEGMKE
ncbi:uncharacterized protein [Cicer arietinum]|uniref:uncharacterized protein n=1 Tax=Cicer arietinum TaxID=3827 RepID=UPI003CC59822